MKRKKERSQEHYGPGSPLALELVDEAPVDSVVEPLNIFYGYGYGSGSDFCKVTVPVLGLVPTF